MPKKRVNIFIRGGHAAGLKPGDTRTINTPNGPREGRIIADLINTIPEKVLCGGKKIKPAKDYYEIEFDE